MKIKLWDTLAQQFKEIDLALVEKLGNVCKFTVIQLVENTLYLARPDYEKVGETAYQVYVDWCHANQHRNK